MFFKIVGLLVLVVVASASPEKTKNRRRSSMEGKLIAGKLARHARAEKTESDADQEIHRVADTPRAYTASRYAVPSLPAVSAGTSTWKTAEFCPAGTFVYGYSQLQNHPLWDGKGLVRIEFRCGEPNMACDSVTPATCPWIQSGLSTASENGPHWMGTCPPNKGMFMTGIQAYFCPSRGALTMKGICEVPNWQRGEPKPAEIVIGEQPDEPEFNEEPDSLSGLIPIDYPVLTRNWEAGKKVRCPAGTAVCGLNTKVDEIESGATDDTGINLIQIMCCPFPAGDGKQ